MRSALPLVLVALLVAGCAAPEPASVAEERPPPIDVPPEGYAIENATIPREEILNATLGEEHVHDLWGEAMELVLFDETLTAGACDGEMDSVFYALQSAFVYQEANYGCVEINLPEGSVVPEGSAAVRIEVDATQALKSGSMVLDWRNKAREEVGETTAQPQHTWRVALTAADWDLPHAQFTTFVFYVGARGPVGVFEGPVAVRVVAEKMADWRPVLAMAHVDHWSLPSMHDFAAPGVMRLFDGEASVTNIDPTRITGDGGSQPLVMRDIVAPGTRFLTIVSDTTSTDCLPRLDCYLVPNLNVGGYERTRFGTLLLEEGARRVYVWSVPDEVAEDSVYANVSTTTIEPRIDACVAEMHEQTCGVTSILSGSATARLQAFAWNRDVDLDLLRALADGAPASG